MSLKKSAKLDLLVRVRYSNPLPAPPCPPKLIDIPTNPLRYANPEFLNAVATDTQLPMIVDADCGMPLDLGHWESLWEERADDDQLLNPNIHNLPRLEPRDAFLLQDAGATAGSFLNVHASASSGPATTLGHVPWLRKTEYLSREGLQRSGIQEQKFAVAAPVDVSRTAQLRDIESSFAQCNDHFDLTTIIHPNKPGITAVDSYPFLPDAEIWANQYDLFRFSERPGEKQLDVDDLRLDCAILRPMKTEHDSFLAYYLTQDDESAMNFKEARSTLLPYEIPEEQEDTIFHFVRDYETVKVEQEVPNEFLLIMDDGSGESTLSIDARNDSMEREKVPRRAKGAYYKNIERKMHLKKKRANAFEQYDDKWEVIRVRHSAMTKEEEIEREEALAEVIDPMFLMQRDLDAEGEIDVTDLHGDMIY